MSVPAARGRWRGKTVRAISRKERRLRGNPMRWLGTCSTWAVLAFISLRAGIAYTNPVWVVCIALGFVAFCASFALEPASRGAACGILLVAAAGTGLLLGMWGEAVVLGALALGLATGVVERRVFSRVNPAP